jgi:hypothetical protein
VLPRAAEKQKRFAYRDRALGKIGSPCMDQVVQIDSPPGNCAANSSTRKTRTARSPPQFGTSTTKNHAHQKKLQEARQKKLA